MKKFSCDCINTQFKVPDQVYVGLQGQQAGIPCVYRPHDKVTLRQARLDVNYCPTCGARMEELQ